MLTAELGSLSRFLLGKGFRGGGHLVGFWSASPATFSRWPRPHGDPSIANSLEITGRDASIIFVDTVLGGSCRSLVHATTSKIPKECLTPPDEQLRNAAKLLGVDVLNCETCTHGYPDHDGEPGGTYYCGMTCSHHDDVLDRSYLEDSDIDIKTEKICWEPDFWKTFVPEIDKLIDGSDAGMDAAVRKWNDLLDRVMPK